jgi:hypothetical protein
MLYFGVKIFGTKRPLIPKPRRAGASCPATEKMCRDTCARKLRYIRTAARTGMDARTRRRR